MDCIIIEDEIPAQNILKNFIKKVPNITLIATFQTANNANNFLKKNTVDFAFLDINLPDILGIDFMKSVKNPPQIIITTAYPDYALNSFELATIRDYLVKPFSFDRFLKAILKIEKSKENNQNTPKNHLFLNIDKTLHKLLFEDILYIESDRNYLSFITHHKAFVLIDSLKNWKEKLQENSFLQVHKSFIINLKKIDKIAGNEIFMSEKRIPIGRTYKKELLVKLGIN